jgi:asparagine synthase (glutamine-hydrolysing)
MCGLTGFLGGALAGEELAPTVRRMADAIRLRGPDSQGEWIDADARVALGHRRLSVVDLSPAGHQPMVSASGRWVLAYNGEIYNHLALRAQLAAQGQAPAWRGHSDTETLLAAIDAWGLAPALQASVGMFALALWDKATATLHLARDRMGEKPLAYGWVGQGEQAVFLFGSELKALRAYPGFQPEVNRSAVAAFMQLGQVPSPLTVFQGLHKLPPGCWLSVSLANRTPVVHRYWALPALGGQAVSGAWSATPAEAVDELGRLLTQAVRGQMVADVPLGAFLSGGVDSSLVAALMQKESAAPVRTFTIGFEEAGFDEAAHAQAVAAHLGTRHTAITLTAAEAMAAVPRLPSVYDEPFADSSQLPTLLVAQLARQQVTVSLSGDGGDELFGGYNRHVFAHRLWHRLAVWPVPLRRALGAACLALSPEAWDRALAWVPEGRRPRQVGDKLHKAGRVLGSQSVPDLHARLVAQWAEPVVLGVGSAWGGMVAPPNLKAQSVDAASLMMWLDQASYLPDDILVKVDRAAMSVSLETRVPMLDHRVVEFAARLPAALKLQGGQGKWLLRQLLYRHVPKHLVDRPKSGFAMPIAGWLRGPLKPWAADLLAPSRLARRGLLDGAVVARRWQEHQSGRRNWAPQLWCALMLEAWLEEWQA